MEVTVRYVKQLNPAIVHHAIDRVPGGKIARYIARVAKIQVIAFCIFGGFMLIAMSTKLPHSHGIGSVVILILLGMLQYLHQYFAAKFKKLEYPEDGYVQAPVRFVIQDDGLNYYKKNTFCRYGWGDFKGIEKVSDNILLYLDLTYFLYFPKKDFENAESYEAFYKELGSRIARAQ